MAVFGKGGRVRGGGHDRHVGQLGDLMDVPDVAVPRVLGDDHPPRPGAEIPALGGFADIGPGFGQVDRPAQAVVGVLERQRRRIAPDRDPGVIDGRDQVIETRRLQRRGLDDLAPAAEVSTLDVVRDDAAQALAFNSGGGGSSPLLNLAGSGADHAFSSGGMFSSFRTSARFSHPVVGFSAFSYCSARVRASARSNPSSSNST